MKPQLHRSFRFSYIRDFSFADYLTVPAMLYDAGRKSHLPDCDMPDILRIFLTLKIPPREVLKIILMLVPSSLCRMIFPFCLISSMIETCFCEYYRRLGQRFLCYFLCPPSCSPKESRAAFAVATQKRV